MTSTFELGRSAAGQPVADGWAGSDDEDDGVAEADGLGAVVLEDGAAEVALRCVDDGAADLGDDALDLLLAGPLDGGSDGALDVGW